MRRSRQVLALVVPLACLAAWGVSRVGLARGDDGPGRKPKSPDARIEPRADRGATTWTTAVRPKPLTWRVQKGLDWLVEHQLPGGGWGEGDQVMQRLQGLMGGDPSRETPDVADTCIASLALIRSGSTPRAGPYRGAIRDGVGYVRTQVEQADAESLAVTGVRGTRAQMKLGPNIDTYLASMLLAEVKGNMPDEASEKAVDLALDKVIRKIERRQVRDGPFEGLGWAPVLAQAMSAKGLNRARQAGARVSDVALAQAEDAARTACRTGGWPTPTELAGLPLELSSRSMATGHARRGHRASRRPTATDDGRSADELSSRSMATHAGEEDIGRRSMLAGAGPVTPPSADGGAARDGEGLGRRSMLAGDNPVNSSSAVGDAAKHGNDNDRRTEIAAASPGAPSHRTRRRIGAAMGPMAGVGGRIMRGAGAAGVQLYDWAACLGILQDSVNTGRAAIPRLRDAAAHPGDPKERAEAERRLARVVDAEKFEQAARAAVIARLDDRRFLAGAGSNGGEEFLSYMTIGESLVVQGGDAWRRWDSGMTEDLYRVQNADGSWSGDHCITGRTFCTSAALLTLMADRTPVPVPARATTSSSYSR